MTLFPLDWKGLYKKMTATEALSPGLYVVATPIGNLGDLTARAADVLCRVDLILAEDTRVTGKLLAHIGSKVPTRRHDDHSSDQERARVVAMLGDKAVALVSDAGTPLISDPGYRLVRDARAAGHAVHTLPGPCAGIAALTLAGLPTDRFLFMGFLPAKPKARDDAIAEVARLRATLVIYESASRLGATLAALSRVLGEREAAVIREITKLHEECVTGQLERPRLPLRRLSAQGRNRNRRRSAAGGCGTKRFRPRFGARRGARDAVALARRGASGRGARDPAQARLCPRPRPVEMNRHVAERRGRSAETIACWYLRLKGWRILARRARASGGEVDIVARRGRTLAFVEVKARVDRRRRRNRARPSSPEARRRRRRAARAALPARRRCDAHRCPVSSSRGAGRIISPMSGKGDKGLRLA